MLLDSQRSALSEYLSSLAGGDPIQTAAREPPPELVAHFHEMLLNTAIVRVKLWDRSGVVVYSTDHRQVGENRVDDAGFFMADRGHVTSNFIRSGTTTSFEKEPERKNLVETYVPVRASPLGPVQGVLEIYTDMNRMVPHRDQIAFIFVVGAALILFGHFAVLVVVARRAKRVVEFEKEKGNARAASLETLAVELFNREDAEKKKVATDLHEELAQTLGAIKLHLEHGGELIAASKGNGGALKSTVPALQDAVQFVRDIATKLWPFTLEDLGLLPTITGYCEEFQRLHPGIRIDEDISLNEQDLPQPLKIVIYRIIESALQSFVHHGDAENVTLCLRLAEKTIELEIDAVATHTSYGPAASRTTAPDLNARFVTVQERAMLSGGTFLAARNNARGVNLLATWKV
jgi:signal transduction histidine kinase